MLGEKRTRKKAKVRIEQRLQDGSSENRQDAALSHEKIRQQILKSPDVAASFFRNELKRQQELGTIFGKVVRCQERCLFETFSSQGSLNSQSWRRTKVKQKEMGIVGKP